MADYYKHSRNKILLKHPKSLKNFDFKKNFYSKIRKDPMYNAFKKKSLGSIPSKFDNYLFNLQNESTSNNNNLKLKKKFQSDNSLFINDIFKKDHLSWNNFGSGNNIELKGNLLNFSINNDLKNSGQKSEFDKKNIDSFKSLFSYSINTNKSTNLSNNISNNFDNIKNKNQNINNTNKKIMFKNKSESKMKFPKEDRYLNIYYKNQIIERYYPGPADYDPKMELDNKNNYRYYSLFKGRTSFPLRDIRSPTADIGPGSYDFSKDLNIPGGNFSKLKKYDNFNSPFKKSDKEIKNGPGSNNLPGSINIKNINKKNYFFMINSPRKIKLEKKLGIERNTNEINKTKDEKKIENICENKNWEKGRSINTDWIYSTLEKKIKEKIKEGNLLFDIINEKGNDKEFILNENYFYMNNGNEIDKNKGKLFSFSKIPRFYDPFNKHVPGPSYYDPEKILYGLKLKKNFNVKENGWI